ncbi:unnamed protein product, partial [Ascophyllum nodosum]
LQYVDTLVGVILHSISNTLDITAWFHCIFDLYLTEKHQDQCQISSHYYLVDATRFVYAAENCSGTCSVTLA